MGRKGLTDQPYLDIVLGGGGRIRTCSLQVMGLTSRPITLPRYSEDGAKVRLEGWMSLPIIFFIEWLLIYVITL